MVIKCTLSALQKIQYRQLSYATLRTRDEKGNLKTTAYNNTIMRLRQVCNHPYLMDDNTVESQWDLGPAMRVRSCGKLDVLDRILPKLKMAGHRVLIYSQMVQLLEILAEYIEEQGYKYNKLVGATSSEVRAKMIEDFNRPDSDTFLFILSTRAGGQGVNLQTADTVIIFDSDWNPMMDEQVAPPLPRAFPPCTPRRPPLLLVLCAQAGLDHGLARWHLRGARSEERGARLRCRVLVRRPRRGSTGSGRRSRRW